MNRRSDTSLMLMCVTVLVVVVVVAASLAFIFAPEKADTTTLVGTLIAVLAPTIASMAAVVKVGGVSTQVADVAADTNKLANGLGDAKIRAAMADVLPDHLVDPEARDQLVADRARLAKPEDHE